MNKSHLTILSFSAGQDSTALFFMYLYDEDFRKRYAPGDLVLVFSDTMDEAPKTYKYLEYIQNICKEHGIPFFWLTPDQGYHAPSWQGLMEKLYLNDSIFGKGMGRSSCTVGLKIDPIYKWLAHYVNEEYMYGMSRAHGKVSLKEFADRYGRIDVLIGFAAGENRHDPDWREKKKKDGEFVAPFWMRHSINKVHPLVEMNMDRKACQEKIRSYGHEVPYPSNCMRCFWASKQELLWLYRNYPGHYHEWVEREQAKVDKNQPRFEAGKIKSNGGVFGKKLLPQILEEAISEFGHWSDEELDDYKFSHGHCVQSAY